tara:strand:- start:1137 stop:1322 length:186 start_codon:yes stop_codon:yes gene_type:complete
MILSKKVIPLDEPKDIYKVIEELNKGARELGKLTLKEQMERIEKMRGGETGKRNLLLAEDL